MVVIKESYHMDPSTCLVYDALIVLALAEIGLGVMRLYPSVSADVC